jgi:hypothetical protein
VVLKIKHARFSARKSRFFAQNAQKFGGTLKNVYLCIVDEDERWSAVGSENYFSGAPKFSPCPERKNREAKIGNVN